MHIKRRSHYITTVAVVFLVIATVHALRLMYGWEGIIGDWEVPFLVSWIAVLVAGWLAWQGFRHRR